MRKKEFWNYDRTDKASGHSLGSRLVHILLIGGCFIASTTILLSLFFYFFPAQAIRSVHAVQTFTEQLMKAEPPPDTDQIATASAVSDAISAGNTAATLPVSGPGKSETPDSEVPSITFSSSLGDVNTIGQSDEKMLFNEDYLVMLDSAMGPMLYYSQGDARWGNYLYGGMDAMSQYGCGPTVVAMLINSFTSHGVTPQDMADWAFDNGCYSPHNGSRHKIIPEALNAYGLQVESAAGADYETAAELLRTGHVLIALMGKGTFSSNGHFIIITNLLENGNVHIADCYNFENTKMEWDLNLLLSELKHSNDDGSPLWAVSYPTTNK